MWGNEPRASGVVRFESSTIRTGAARGGMLFLLSLSKLKE